MLIDKEYKLIGVTGDIHTENKFLVKAIEFLRSKNVEKILCVGDIVDGQGDVNKCCKVLQNEEILVVLGNHDRWFLNGEMRDLEEATAPTCLSESSRSFLKALPITYKFLTPRGSALLCHGLGKNDMARLTPDDYGYSIENNAELQALIQEGKYRYVINGHTHYRMVRNFDGLTVINAGTLKRNHNPVFLVVSFIHNFVHFYEFDEHLMVREAEKIYLEAIRSTRRMFEKH